MSEAVQVRLEIVKALLNSSRAGIIPETQQPKTLREEVDEIEAIVFRIPYAEPEAGGEEGDAATR